MASSGYCDTPTYKELTLRFYWTQTPDVNNNRSVINWSVTGYINSGYVVCSEMNLIVNNTSVYSLPQSNHVSVRNGDTFASGSFYLNHASDGTATMTVDCGIGVYEWAINKHATGTWTLDPIGGASTVSVSGAFTMGSSGTISISRASSAYTHTLTYAFGSASGTITTKTSSTSVSWTPPLTLANQIPSAVSGTGTITCYTYYGNTLVGSSTCSFTANVPASVKPSISSFTASRVDNDVPSSWGIYVQGKSQCYLSASASGSYGSTIRSYAIKQGDTTLASASSVTTPILAVAGQITYTVIVTDSRGRTASATVTITVEAYLTPYATNILSQRCLSDGTVSDEGTYIKTTATINYTSFSGKNTCTTKLYYHRAGETSWTLVQNPYTSGNTVLFNAAASVDYSYEVMYEMTDALTTVQRIDEVSSGFTTMDFRKGGRGVAIGKVSEVDDLFDVAMNVKFHAGFTIVENGVSYDVLALLKRIN